MRRLRYFSYGNNIKCSSLPKQLCSGASTSKLISSFEKETRSIEGERETATRRLRSFSYGNNIKCSSLPKQLCSGASTSKLISSFEKEKRSI